MNKYVVDGKQEKLLDMQINVNAVIAQMLVISPVLIEENFEKYVTEDGFFGERLLHDLLKAAIDEHETQLFGLGRIDSPPET